MNEKWNVNIYELSCDTTRWAVGVCCVCVRKIRRRVCIVCSRHIHTRDLRVTSPRLNFAVLASLSPVYIIVIPNLISCYSHGVENSAVAEYTRERHFSLVRRRGVGTYIVLIGSGSIAIIYILCKRTIKGRIRCRAVAVFIRIRH